LLIQQGWDDVKRDGDGGEPATRGFAGGSGGGLGEIKENSQFKYVLSV
jgi:hypothetical protein